MMSARPAGPKPKKPRRDFPLFAHASGTWAKTVNGKHVHFGPWHDPLGAEARWREYDDARKAGRNPRPVSDGSVTLKELGNRFSTFHHNRALAGEIRLSSFRDIKRAVKNFLALVGEWVQVGKLTPDQFGAFRTWLAKTNKSYAINRNITLVKSMFKWAYDNDLIDRPIKFGPGFAKAKASSQRRGKKVRMFTADEIRMMLENAKQPLKAMLLLGINCGFGNTDVGTLTRSAIDLDAGVIDTHRAKTGVARRCVLWPETVAALKEVYASRPKPKNPDDADLVFVTFWGAPFVREVKKEKNGVIIKVTAIDSLALLFRSLMATIELWKINAKTGRPASDGRSFYTLRRTHRTWSDECADPHAAALIMGHDFNSVAGLYVQRIEDHRLHSIANHLHKKLFDQKN
jgi:integrase